MASPLNDRPADLLPALIEIAKSAGREIMEVYGSSFSVEHKQDHSPLTEADRRSHVTIAEGLRSLSNLPLLSEEGTGISYEARRGWKTFWLVDPLDGTKEFIKRNGEFTVNIALVDHGRPVVAVILAPAAGVLYYGAAGTGAWKLSEGRTIRLPRIERDGTLRIVGSRSHASDDYRAYVERIKKSHAKTDFISAGSSLKFCLVAEGTADLYPRLGPTMEWDTAAGQLIVEEAGGRVESFSTRAPLRYNKEQLQNPHFIAFGRGTDV